MKKTLLCFLFLLLTNLFYAQVSDIEHCPGDTSFNLTTKNSELLGNLNPAETTISFHLSLSDANNNLNAITTPTNYSSSALSKTIYARIDNNGTVTTNFFNVKVNDVITFIHTKTSISCYAGNDGIITVNVSGGKAPYAYKLDNGSYTVYGPGSIMTFTNLSAGTHTIQIKDDLGCNVSAPQAIDIVEPTLLYANVVVENQNIILVNATGGYAEYEYSLNGNSFQKSPIFPNVQPGAHRVMVKDSHGCTYEIPVVVYPLLAAAATATPSNCITGSTITATATGGTGSYMYSFDNGKTFTTSNIFMNVPPGNYTVIIKDSQNNTGSTIIQVQPAPLLVVSSQVENIRCKGDNTGSIKLIATGGQLPYAYSFNGGPYQTKSTFDNLSTGEYLIYARDAAGCTVAVVSRILEPAMPLMANVTVENQTITINAEGGTGQISYSLSYTGYSTQNVYSNLTPGVYQAMAKDENGCLIMYFAEVKTPAAPLIDGKSEFVFEFKPGQTLADIIVDGQNIKWYSAKNPLSGKKSKTSKTTAAEPTLPPTTVLVDGTTYYASQTINGVESVERLAVTAKSNGSLATVDFDFVNFKYSPNPVKHILTLTNSESIDQIEIFSVSGNSVLSKKINAAHSEIDLSSLSSGVYLLKVKSDGKEKTMKIIKE